MAPKDKKTSPVSTSTFQSEKSKKEEAKKKEELEDALSEEDKQLKERLDTCVATITNQSNEASVTVGIRQKALDVIVTELRTATSSMTSVPKPLKFLRPHFAAIKKVFTEFSIATDNESIEFRARVADVLAVLAMTMGNPGECSMN
jgi:26S proteasome regulatory subunit N1